MTNDQRKRDDDRLVLNRRDVENMRRAHIQGLRACDRLLGWETEVKRVRPSSSPDGHGHQGKGNNL